MVPKVRVSLLSGIFMNIPHKIDDSICFRVIYIFPMRYRLLSIILLLHVPLLLVYARIDIQVLTSFSESAPRQVSDRARMETGSLCNNSRISDNLPSILLQLICVMAKDAAGIDIFCSRA